MGRGERSKAATKTAQDLLFGPRRASAINPLKGKAGKRQVEEIVERMNKTGSYNEALGFLLRHNDEVNNNNLDHLAEAMSERIALSSPDDLANICTAIDKEISRDSNIPALTKLADAIGAAVANESLRGDLTQEALDFTTRDHPLASEVREQWARTRPSQMMAYSSGQFPATISAEDGFRLRQALYQGARDDYNVPTEVFSNKAVIDDLKQGRPDMDAVIDQIEEACRKRGGFNLFAAPINISDPNFNKGVSDYDLGEFLRAMPDQDKVKNLLTAFAQSEYTSPNYVNTLADIQNKLGQMGRKDSDPALSIDSHKRIETAAQRLIDNFAEATINGNRGGVIDNYKQALAQEIAATCKPANLNDKTRLFVDFDQSPDGDAFRPWQRFKHQHLSRSLMPDRKVEIEQKEWADVIKSSLTAQYGSPFSMKLSGRLLVAGLAGIYRSRANKDESIDPIG